MPGLLKFFFMIFIACNLVSDSCSAVIKLKHAHSVSIVESTSGAHPNVSHKAKRLLWILKRISPGETEKYTNASNTPVLGIASFWSSIASVFFLNMGFVQLLQPFFVFGYMFVAAAIVLGIFGLEKHKRFKGFAITSLIISGLALALSLLILAVATVPIT